MGSADPAEQLELQNRRREDARPATTIVNELDHCIEIHADVHIIYLQYKEEYDQLLDAIRCFSDIQIRDRDKKACVIHYLCKGISAFMDKSPLPALPNAIGKMLIDTEFTEILTGRVMTNAREENIDGVII